MFGICKTIVLLTLSLASIEAESEITFRLEDGRSPREGRVIVEYDGRSGTICNRRFNGNSADLICRELGFTTGRFDIRFFGRPKTVTPIALEYFQCYSGDDYPWSCNKAPFFAPTRCQHDQDVGLECDVPPEDTAAIRQATANAYEATWVTTTDRSEDITFKLVDGLSIDEGRVLAIFRGFSGTICKRRFGGGSARVICRALGYDGNYEVRSYGAASSNTAIALEQFECDSYETDPTRCQHPQFFAENTCRHEQDVGVKCGRITFDCSKWNPCLPSRFVSGKFKYSHADVTKVVNCLVAKDGNLGCAVTSCRPRHVYDDTAQSCKLRTYDCGDNGRNPCDPPAIEGKTAYPHQDKAKMVKCQDGRCKVVPCHHDHYFDDAAQACLPNLYNCAQCRKPGTTGKNYVLPYATLHFLCISRRCYPSSCGSGFYLSAVTQLCAKRARVCLRGEYSLNKKCIPCPRGTRSRFLDQRRCGPCPYGTHQHRQGLGRCIKCAAGKFADSTGSVYCMKCPKGTFQNRSGQRTCIPCQLGYYQDKLEQTSCNTCKPGFYANVVGRRGCLACKLGTYSQGRAQTSCQSCPDGTTTANKASTSIDQCLPTTEPAIP